MTNKCQVAGREVDLVWSQEVGKRFAFRMGEIGGEPSSKQLSDPRTVSTALFKVLWGLLPSNLFALYSDPESLFVAVDHETEAEGIFAAIKGVYDERFPSEEKKSTSEKSPSPGSNSD